MSMKKFLVFIVSMFAFVFANNINAQTISAGYLRSTYTSKYDGTTYSMNGNGLFVGADIDVDLTDGLAFTPGLFFDYANYEILDNIHANVYYLRAPLHIKYTYYLEKDLSLFVDGGPGLSYGLGGKVRYHNGGIDVNEDFFTDDDRRFDIPLGLEVGANLPYNLRLTFGYDWGLLNQSADDDDNVRRNFLHVGLGYRF